MFPNCTELKHSAAKMPDAAAVEKALAEAGVAGKMDEDLKEYVVGTLSDEARPRRGSASRRRLANSGCTHLCAPRTPCAAPLA